MQDSAYPNDIELKLQVKECTIMVLGKTASISKAVLRNVERSLNL